MMPPVYHGPTTAPRIQDIIPLSPVGQSGWRLAPLLTSAAALSLPWELGPNEFTAHAFSPKAMLYQMNSPAPTLNIKNPNSRKKEKDARKNKNAVRNPFGYIHFAIFANRHHSGARHQEY
ncbi:MAG: hypothetical protein H8E15_02890 [Planctomycetes bacterium]|nr:hypothetical protein [Planctomycetota bacterium]